MTWQELRTGVYEPDGSMRDLCVLAATRQQWHEWVAYVNQHYRVEWSAEDHHEGQKFPAIDQDYIARRWDKGAEALSTSACLFLGHVHVTCNFTSEEVIENVIAPWEFTSLEDHDRLMAYLVEWSTELGTEVLVTYESFHEGVYIRVKGTTIQFE